MVIMSIYDAKAEVYSTPMFLRSKGEGIRAFQSEVNSGDEKSSLCKYPEDFTLFMLGEFWPETGQIEAQPPVSVVSGVAVKIQEA